MNVHLVDGTYELFRSHFGAPGATSPDGVEVGAVRGLLRSMVALLRDDAVTHVAIAFDHVIESFRNDLFAGYKTGEGLDPELYAQFPLAERAMTALGLVVWPMVEFEADDALATFAARAEADPRVDRVLLCSPDKDLTQCVQGGRVVVLDRARKKILEADDVIAKFGVEPRQIPDYLALVGDTADGIPGLPGWGAKSTAAVLSRHGTIDSIPRDADDWDVRVRGAARLAERLRAHRDDALLYRRLATLRTDVPLTETVDDLAWRGADRDALPALCAELGERAVLDRIPRWRS
jgi:5'-3' exonuclease